MEAGEEPLPPQLVPVMGLPAALTTLFLEAGAGIQAAFATIAEACSAPDAGRAA